VAPCGVYQPVQCCSVSPPHHHHMPPLTAVVGHLPHMCTLRTAVREPLPMNLQHLAERVWAGFSELISDLQTMFRVLPRRFGVLWAFARS
jgi:hypothetical protein